MTIEENVTNTNGFLEELANLRRQREDQERERKEILLLQSNKKSATKDRSAEKEKLLARQAKEETRLRQMSEALKLQRIKTANSPVK